MEINLKTNDDYIKQEQKSSQQSSIQKKDTKQMFLHQQNIHDIVEKISQRQLYARKIIQSIPFQTIITILALFSLFSDDIRTAAFDGSVDLIFDCIHLFLLFIFSVQIVLMFYSMPEYRFTFFFYLDIISSLSLLLDVSLITSLLYANNSGTYDISQIAVQARASRVATRAIRIVKLVRIIRIIKMYKAASQTAQLKQEQKKKKLEYELKRQMKEYNDKQLGPSGITEYGENQEATKREFIANRRLEEAAQKDDFIVNSEMIQQANRKQSKISKVLTQLTIQKIVIVVLLIMFIVPLFQSDNYIAKPDSWQFTDDNIHLLLKNTDIEIKKINEFITQAINNRSDSGNLIIFFDTPFQQVISYEERNAGTYRAQEVAISYQTLDISTILQNRPELTIKSNLSSENQYSIHTIMYYRRNSQIDAIFSISKTLLICIILIGLLYFFTKDINDLIVEPAEKMMNHVIQIARNPEVAATSQFQDGKYETALVHNAIIKIGALLSLVFGSAGAQIIGSNIMKQGDMDPMVGGKKKCAIFGFCDIRGFTQVTEILQQQIMIFVNKIGSIIHSSVFKYGGSANKNIGQAFLLVWQLPDKSYRINPVNNQIIWKDKETVSLMSDYSVFGFIESILRINTNQDILRYSKDERLTKYFGNNYKVTMGFGLHIGWAIQGAIGSQYKIDASYLSPNVNMASRLEAATRQYGVDLLLSQDLYDTLTPSLKNFCRYIDRVTVKGSAKPIRLYTIDLKLHKINLPLTKEKGSDVQLERQLNMQNFSQRFISQYNAQKFICKKKYLRQIMIDSLPQSFLALHEKGVKDYIQGYWEQASKKLYQASKIIPQDGPTNNILSYISKYNYKTPQNWMNYRPLTSK